MIPPSRAAGVARFVGLVVLGAAPPEGVATEHGQPTPTVAAATTGTATTAAAPIEPNVLHPEPVVAVIVFLLLLWIAALVRRRRTG